MWWFWQWYQPYVGVKSEEENRQKRCSLYRKYTKHATGVLVKDHPEWSPHSFSSICSLVIVMMVQICDRYPFFTTSPPRPYVYLKLKQIILLFCVALALYLSLSENSFSRFDFGWLFTSISFHRGVFGVFFVAISFQVKWLLCVIYKVT